MDTFAGRSGQACGGWASCTKGAAIAPRRATLTAASSTSGRRLTPSCSPSSRRPARHETGSAASRGSRPEARSANGEARAGAAQGRDSQRERLLGGSGEYHRVYAGLPPRGSSRGERGEKGKAHEWRAIGLRRRAEATGTAIRRPAVSGDGTG